MFLSIIELLAKVAIADGVVHPHEKRMLLSAVRIFRIDRKEYDRFVGYYQNNIDKYCAVLACSRYDSNAEIKKKYRKLAVDFHPDKIIAKGLPEEFVKFANDKFRKIQEAY